MTELSPISNATCPQLHLPNPPRQLALFSFSLHSPPVPLYGARLNPSSHSAPGYVPDQIFSTPTTSMLPLPSLFYPAFSISLPSPLLPAAPSTLHLYQLTRSTHTGRPLAYPRTPSILSYGFAFFRTFRLFFLLHTFSTALCPRSSTGTY